MVPTAHLTILERLTLLTLRAHAKEACYNTKQPNWPDVTAHTRIRQIWLNDRNLNKYIAKNNVVLSKYVDHAYMYCGILNHV